MRATTVIYSYGFDNSVQRGQQNDLAKSIALWRACQHFSNKGNSYLNGKDQSTGRNSCPNQQLTGVLVQNHPIFMTNVTLN